jgi:hypothetical protein
MKKFALIPLLALLAFSACDDDDPISPNNQARVRIVNASNTNANVQLFEGNTQLGTGNIAFQSTSTCGAIAVAPGSKTLSFRAPGSATPIATTTAVNFQADRDYLVVLLPGGSATVIEEQPFPNPVAGNNAIRIVNAQTTAGDVYATTGNTTPIPANKINIGAGASTTTYQAIGSTATTFRMFDAGATTFTAPRANFIIGGTGVNRTSTVFLTSAAIGSSVTGFQVNRCAT